MANTDRRKNYIDEQGNMFMPMNVEGSSFNEHFITTPKLITIVVIIIIGFFMFTSLNSERASFLKYVLYIGTWLFGSSLAIRYIVFEEKFYSKMYKELKKNKVTTPALFWNIGSIKDTEDGAIIQYYDGKIAVILKLERDTIIGKTKDFRETHFDALSDFYKELGVRKYKWVQMNTMEPAGKDPRLNTLSKIVYKSDNKNIQKLMQLQVGHIKNITHNTSHEMDYFLIYTEDLTRLDVIIEDVTEAVFKLLDGAYINYCILDSDAANLVKEEFNVGYFNAAEASISMFTRQNGDMTPPFEISHILWKDGELQELNNQEKLKLKKLTSSIIRGNTKKNKISFKRALYRKDVKNNIGIEIDKISGDYIDESSQASNNVDDFENTISITLEKTKEPNKDIMSISKKNNNTKANLKKKKKEEDDLPTSYSNGVDFSKMNDYIDL